MDVNLIPLNPKLISNGIGIINQGATCYMNSLIQCLLSCTSIYERLCELREEKNEAFSKNKIANCLLELFEVSLQNKPLTEVVIRIWHAIINKSREKSTDHVHMDYGQQDIHEGFMMLLESIEDVPSLHKLFKHAHISTVLCIKCKVFSTKREINCVLEVQPDLKTEQSKTIKFLDKYSEATSLNEFLEKQVGCTDKDYICDKCKERKERPRITKLTMVSEILPVLFKKYGSKTNTEFPKHLKFTLSNGDNIIYLIVAKAEHSGNQRGGHYWATCLRNKQAANLTQQWLTLNDQNISPGTSEPTPNTYMVFYHFLCIENKD